MSNLPIRTFVKSILSCLTLVLAMTAGAAVAAPISYGNFSGSDVDYLNVTENSLTDVPPLFGMPTVSGNTLNFTPTNFVASTSGGGVDITDGLLTSLVMATGGAPILSVDVSESGLYTLSGAGTAATAAAVATPVFLTILQIDNANITPFAIQGLLNATPSGGTFDLIADGGTNVAWSSSLTIDVAAAVAARGFSGNATKLQLTLDNTLVAASQAQSTAIIGKDDVTITVNTPEPSSLALAALGLAVVLAGRVRRRG